MLRPASCPILCMDLTPGYSGSADGPVREEHFRCAKEGRRHRFHRYDLPRTVLRDTAVYQMQR